MNPIIRAGLVAIFFLAVFGAQASATSIEQQLVVLTNEKTLNGSFQVQVQVKGTALPATNTLISATLWIQFDRAKLHYVNGTNFAFGGAEGYNRTALDNGSFVVFGISSFVNGNGDGSPPGFDIGTSYVTWVQLNFTILDPTGTTALTIDPPSNAVDFYDSHGNSNGTGAALSPSPTWTRINLTDVALPVQLASFTASTVQQSGHVFLKWTTLTETNNYGFEVEKAKDSAKSFVTIDNSFVAGHGTTVDSHTYTFTDASASPGTWYYRLKQTDLDGSVHYSDGIRPSGVTSVDGKPLPTAYALDQNYPNPFNPSTNIEFALPKESKVTLEVFNMIGQRVAVLVDGVRPAGYHSQRFDGSSVGTGVYFYRLTAGETSFLKKMLLVK